MEIFEVYYGEQIFLLFISLWGINGICSQFCPAAPRGFCHPGRHGEVEGLGWKN